MNLRDLQYLVAVAEQRHFGKAAETCFVSQPTLSAQIKKIEDELGVKLFERTNKSVRVTPIGETVLHHARLALEQVELIREVARDQRDPLAGALRVGVIPTLGPYLTPLILRPLRETYPQLRLVLSEEITDNLVRRLKSHEIDAALLATATDDPELVSEPLFDEPFWLAHPRDHRLYAEDEITQDTIADLDLLLLADGHCLADQVREVCGAAGEGGANELGDLRASSLETLMQLVSSGYGCTLLPALAIRGPWLTDMGVIVRQLDLDNGYRRVSLVFRRSFPRRPALRALAELVRERLPNTVRPCPPQLLADEASAGTGGGAVRPVGASAKG